MGVLRLVVGSLVVSSSLVAQDAALTSAEGDVGVLRELWGAPRPIVRDVVVESGFAGSTLVATSATVNQDPEGDLPREIAFLADGSAAVVVHRDTDTLTFVDVAPFGPSDTVTVGDFPTDVAVAPVGNRAIVPNVFDNTVSIVDTVTRAVVSTVPITGDQPFGVEVSADGTTAVVSVINDGVTSAFSVIAVGAGVEVRSIPTSGQGGIGFFLTPESGISGNIYTQFALTPDGQTLVLPDRAGGVVRFYDVNSGVELGVVTTDAAPVSIDLSDDGTTAVVGHESGVNTISVLDVATRTLTSSIPVTAGSLTGQVVRITPDKTHAIAAISNNAIFVNLATGVTTAVISTGTVGDIEISFDGQYAFVSNFNSRVIDIASQSLVATLSLAPTYEAAASPVENRVMALNNRFREDVHMYTTNGGASSVVGRVVSAEPAEGDAPRTLAISPDGATALVGCNTSRNAALLDVATGSVTAYPDCGDRVLGVAIAPDGVHGVVCNGDENTVTIIDMASGISVAQIPISTRPTDVVISPDSSTAYVSSIAGTDRLHRISLNGAASAATGSIPTGQLGSVIYTYNVTSGLGISPDGSLVAACVSFDDELLLVDTATLTEVARVPVGDFPVRVTFTADGSKAYVVNGFGDSVSVVDVAGAASAVSSTIGGVEFPLVNVADDAGDWHFVGNFDGNDPRLFVIDTSTDTVATSVLLPSAPRAAAYSATDDAVFVATTGGELVRVSSAGATSAVVDQVDLVGGASDLVFSDALGVVVTAQPGISDSVDLVDVRPGPFVDLGNGLSGAFGVPLLVGTGDLTVGSPTSLNLSGAASNTITTLVVGLSEASVPFKGGVLVPAPDALLGGFPTGLLGLLNLSAPWPSGIPSGTQIWFQHWIIDGAGPVGFSASNALRADVP